jgi:DNA polymerase I
MHRACRQPHIPNARRKTLRSENHTMATPERLFLLDGMALAYRAYFAFISRPLVNSKGVNTSAVYGFVTALMRILDEERPDHIAVVFDTPEPTFRHKRYPAYKATRQKMPEDMASQLDKLKEAVRAFNVPLLEVPGFEADDIMGTLARRAEHENVITYLVTGDKDFMQLISPKILMYRPGKAGSDSEVVDASGVREKFGVAPEQVIDVLGLIGDKSDNVPGVPGIGDKTAIPLIQMYGTMSAVYDHLDEIPQKGVREKLRTHRDLAFLSRELVTIHTDVPLDIDFHGLRAASRDTQALIRLFDELEFRSLAGKLRDAAVREVTFEAPPMAFPPPQTTNISTEYHTYHLVTTPAELAALCATLAAQTEIVVDTETTSTDALAADLVGISLTWKEREAWYIPVSRGQHDLLDGAGNGVTPGIELAEIVRLLGPVLENAAIAKIGQNIKYDMLVLHRHGMCLEGPLFDTMVASYILRPDGQHNLDALALEYCHYAMVPLHDLIGKGKTQKPITEVPLQALADYSAEDADVTLRIRNCQKPRLEEMGTGRLCAEVEFPLIPVLARMERAGVKLDTGYLQQMSKDLERQLLILEEAIHRDAGGPFNINSTQQLAVILFQKLQLPTVRKTKTGFSTDITVLESLRGRHPIIDHLLDYRQLSKLKSTYVDALPGLVNAGTGKVHTSFNQTIATTGRLSSSDPNLQNIPIRTDLGRAIRKAFIPGSPGCVLLSADYSQIELRIMAHISKDPALIEAFKRGDDIHTATAAGVFGVDAAAVTRDMRRKAKEVNFGIMYGIAAFGLANRLEISQQEARTIISTYFARFPGVLAYINATRDAARRTGYVSSMLGRRRYLPDINSRNQNIRGNAERQAINMPIQGTAADMIKIAMIRIDREMRERRLRGSMILQVHDELVFEVPEDEVETLSPIIRRHMRDALPLDVPIEVDVGTGRDWLEAH